MNYVMKCQYICFQATQSSLKWLNLEHRELENLQQTFRGDEDGLNESAATFSAVFWKTLIDKGIQ